MTDDIRIKIEEDGTVSFDTDRISDTNHVSADEFLKEMEEVLGGRVDIKGKDKQQHIHHHHDNHVHTH